jgi:hypothetical protein
VLLDAGYQHAGVGGDVAAGSLVKIMHKCQSGNEIMVRRIAVITAGHHASRQLEDTAMAAR